MNKGELVDAIATDANLSKTDAESALNAFINSVQSAITAGEKVTLPGFGTFSPALRKARTGMDPRKRNRYGRFRSVRSEASPWARKSKAGVQGGPDRVGAGPPSRTE